ncbi:MAG: SsrA-binding protein SmpB [Patescibacteria group bacterium]
MSSFQQQTIAENRRAGFDYEISEKFEAGIELRGLEVKSAKAGKMQIAGSYSIIRGGEVYLINCRVPPYQTGNTPPDYDPGRTRRLLLNKGEIKRLGGLLRQKTVSLITLRAYIKNNLIKIELGLGRAKKKHDKRELLKKRAVEMETGRRLK